MSGLLKKRPCHKRCASHVGSSAPHISTQMYAMYTEIYTAMVNIYIYISVCKLYPWGTILGGTSRGCKFAKLINKAARSLAPHRQLKRSLSRKGAKRAVTPCAYTYLLTRLWQIQVDKTLGESHRAGSGEISIVHVQCRSENYPAEQTAMRYIW